MKNAIVDAICGGLMIVGLMCGLIVLAKLIGMGINELAWRVW